MTTNAAAVSCTGRKRRAITSFSDGNRSSAETRRSRFQSTRGRKRRQGRKIPTLSDHHHLHLYLHLLHYHIFSFKRNVHSTRGKQLLIVCSPYMWSCVFVCQTSILCIVVGI